MPLFAEVALPIPRLEPLTYAVPETGRVEPGCRVAATVGRRVLNGVVVAVFEAARAPRPDIKPLVKILEDEPALPRELLDLGKWMADYYQCAWGESLAAMLPTAMKPGVREKYRLADPPPGKETPGRGTAQVLLERLAAGPLLKKELLKDLAASAGQVLKRLEDEGWVASETRLAKPRPTAKDEAAAFVPESALTLTASQSEAMHRLRAGLAEKTFQTFLLHGVTGSGKTEVYLQAIAQVLAQGRGAIFLVPEISLTPQTCRRVQARFGQLVSVLHSGLTPKQRADAWFRLRSGASRVALGARSAIFAPVRELGLIVVDEEPEGSYKQEDAPRYHARDVAAVRAQRHGALLLMGSATPSVETYYKAISGRFQLLRLPERVDNKLLPEVRLLDLGQAWHKTGSYQLISDELLLALESNLKQAGQSILFLNRRGFAPVVMCPACRHVLVCPDCSVAMVYHQAGDCLRCHSCGRKSPARPGCPQCGTACVKLKGAGTQRVEEEVARLLPAARILRVDQDATRKRGFLDEAFQRFGRREADILIGTQMVAKGIDFPGVTLVGIVSADTGLHLPDFRAEERVFQLIVQVAGRAGRGERPGLVLVQTLNPDHPVLSLARKHDYEAFYAREIDQRKALGYPPFSRLANIVCRSQDSRAALQAAEHISRRLGALAGPQDTILGPAPSPHEKIAGQVRYQLLVKSRTPGSRARLLAVVAAMAQKSGVHVSIDVDPVHLL